MFRVGLGGLGASLFLTACVTATPVAGPNGEAQLIRCSNTADCYDKAKEICGGPYRILDSGNDVSSTSVPRSSLVRTTGGGWASVTQNETTVSSSKEILVECGTEAPAAATQAAKNGASEKPARATDEASAPKTAAGFTFGDSVESASSECTNAGHDWKVTGSRFTCTGTPVDTGLDAEARLSFCSDTLCRIEVISPPPAEPAKLEKRLRKVLEALRERYGEATRREVTMPQSCSGTALPDCLEQNRARFLYQWTWKGKRAVTLSLGPRRSVEAYEEPTKRTDSERAALLTIRIRYDEGRKPSAAAEATGDRDVSGL